jgi:hypothetical protein
MTLSRFYAHDHKMSGALCHGLCVGASVSVNIWFPSIIGQTPGSIDPIFLWLVGGWLEEGSFRWSPPPLIQDGRYGRHLRFGFRRLQDKRLGRLIRFLCGSFGVTRGRFLSMITSAAHPWFVGASSGVINLHHVPLLPNPYPYTHRQRPNRGHVPRLALPLLNLICPIVWNDSEFRLDDFM